MSSEGGPDKSKEPAKGKEPAKDEDPDEWANMFNHLLHPMDNKFWNERLLCRFCCKNESLSSNERVCYPCRERNICPCCTKPKMKGESYCTIHICKGGCDRSLPIFYGKDKMGRWAYFPLCPDCLNCLKTACVRCLSTERMEGFDHCKGCVCAKVGCTGTKYEDHIVCKTCLKDMCVRCYYNRDNYVRCVEGSEFCAKCKCSVRGCVHPSVAEYRFESDFCSTHGCAQCVDRRVVNAKLRMPECKDPRMLHIWKRLFGDNVLPGCGEHLPPNIVEKFKLFKLINTILVCNERNSKRSKEVVAAAAKHETISAKECFRLGVDYELLQVIQLVIEKMPHLPPDIISLIFKQY